MGIQLSDDELLAAYGPLEVEDFPRGFLASALPRTSAALSTLAVIVTTFEAYAEHKSGNGTVVTSVVLAYQLPLLVASVCFLIGSLAAPKVLSRFVQGAAGSITTCRVQGFLLQFSAVSGLAFDVILTTCFLLKVRFCWRDKSLRKLERVAHAAIWPFALANAVFPLLLNAYHISTAGTCWIQSVPTSCSNVRGKDCVLGHHHRIFFLILATLSVFTMLYSSSAMITIYLHVRKTESRTRNYSMRSIPARSDGAVEAAYRRSQQTAYQGILHASTFIISALPLTITNLFPTGTYQQYDAYVHALNASPGLLNMLVFLRPRKMQTRIGQWTKGTLTAVTCGRCFCCPRPRAHRQHGGVDGNGENDTTNTASATENQILSWARRSSSSRNGRGFFFWSERNLGDIPSETVDANVLGQDEEALEHQTDDKTLHN